MFCKNCGNKLSDTASFCPECGIKVKKEESKTSTENKKITNISNGLETRVERNKNNKKNNSTIIISAILAIVVIVGIVVIISPWKSHDSYKPTEVIVENDKNEAMLKDSSKSTSKKKSNKSDTKKEEEQTNNDYILNNNSEERVDYGGGIYLSYHIDKTKHWNGDFNQTIAVTSGFKNKEYDILIWVTLKSDPSIGSNIITLRCRPYN